MSRRSPESPKAAAVTGAHQNETGRMTPRFAFDNTYSRLPERFYARLAPVRVAAPRLVRVNEALAEALGLDPDALRTDEGAAVFAGNCVPDGAAPMALAY